MCRPDGRVLTAGLLFVLFSAAAASVWILWPYSKASDSAAPQEVGSTADSQRQAVIDGLVTAIGAQSRGGQAPLIVQAPPPRRHAPALPDPETGAAERRPAPDGYAYATFERSARPQKAEGQSDAGRAPESPAWLGSPDALAVVAANAKSAGREWSFGWVRPRADARPEDLVAALTSLGVAVEGKSGTLIRARLPGDPEQLRAIVALPEVDGLGAQPPSAKLPASFAEEARTAPAHEIVPVFVTLAAAGDDDSRWRAELQRLGAVVGNYDADTRSYAANVSYHILDAVAAADFVAFIEPVGIVEVANDTAVPAMGADAYRRYTETGGWNGTAGQGVTVGVMDTGLNINHLDIEAGRRSICGANFIPGLAEAEDLWFDADGHGTHVTGIVSGSGAAEPRYAGMAPLAPHVRFAKVLSSQGVGSATSVLDGMDFLSDASGCSAAGWTADEVKAMIVNMSLSRRGLTFEGRDVPARKLDAVVWNARQLYVVANSNASIYGFSNYGAAKNSLPVGAAYDSGELVGFSSLGPTADGRLAPLVVGTGYHVQSAQGRGVRTGYWRLSGTSMSSPAVTGVAALLMDAQPVFQWNPALARALLMSSAIKPDVWLDARQAFPADNTDGPGTMHARYGLGKVSGTTSVFDRPEADGWQSGGWHDILLDSGEYAAHDIDVPEAATRLDVVLTWDEPPADVIANTVLNNLDLWLDDGGDCTDARCGERSSRSGIDNVEWIIVRDPQPGRWTAKVVAERVYGVKPRAALAYTVVRGPSTPQLAVVADPGTLDVNGGEVMLTVSADGYVAAGTRLAMDCRYAGDNPSPCGFPTATYEVLDDDAPAQGRSDIDHGEFVALGEIRAGESETVRFHIPSLDSRASVHFTVTGWNAGGDTVAIYAEEAAEDGFTTPANDDFSGATEIEDSAEGDLLLATTEPGEPAFEGGAERPAASVWYRWQATADGPVHFSLTPSEAFRGHASPRAYSRPVLDMRVDVFRGENLTGAQMVASAPWGTSFVAERGVEYLIRVACRTRTARFTITLRQGGVPDNDAFDAAVLLEGSEGETVGTNAGATLESGEIFGALAATVWYRWMAPADGWYEFSASAPHLKVLAFGDASAIGNLRLVSGFPADRIRFPAKAGVSYRVAVASADAEASGSAFELAWSTTADRHDGNDLLENAHSFPNKGSSGNDKVPVSLGQFATVEPDEHHESGVRTAWWSWVAPRTSEYTWWLERNDRLRLAAFSGDALADLEFLGDNEGLTGRFSFAAVQGEPYRFAAGARRSHAFDTRSASSTVTWGPTPTNDAWSRARVLASPEGTVRGSNRFATVERHERLRGVGHSSLWWLFEAPSPGFYRFWIEESDLPFTLSVYAHDPGAALGQLELIVSSERGLTDSIEVFFHAESAGERFAVRLGTRGDAQGDAFTLRWEEGEAGAWLRYRGHTDARYQFVDGDGATVELHDFRSLTIDDSGRALYAASDGGIAVFARNPGDGNLEFMEGLESDGAWLVLWDAPRHRLLSFQGCLVRSYTPVDGNVRTLEYRGNVPVANDAPCSSFVTSSSRRAFADPEEPLIYLLEPGKRMMVLSVDEDGAMTYLRQQGMPARDAAISKTGEYVYAISISQLRTRQRNDLTVVHTMGLAQAVARDTLAVSDDDSRVFTWGDSGASVVDVSDPRNPILIGETELTSDLDCQFAVARRARYAADAFCHDGAAYVLEWRDGSLELADIVAHRAPNRYNDVVPAFQLVYGFAASPDGRHAYVSTPELGIIAYERVGNGTATDDHDDSREAATTVPSLPWTGPGELELPGDRDMFRIDLTGSGTLTVGTTGETDTYGTLMDADGTVLTEDDDSGAMSNFEMVARVAAGTHYVEVRGTDNETTGTYALSIEFAPDARAVVFAPQRALSTNADGATSVYAADLDGDGDTDVLSASYADDSIAWQENFSRSAFSARRMIGTAADGARSVHAADLDGDGDPDVVSASSRDDKIAWYENLGGGRFSSQRIISTNADSARSVHAADLDGDGDLDVLSASANDDRIAWHENLGGGEFSTQHTIGKDADRALSVYTADIDGDGDPDVLSASWGDDKIAWYENLGGGTFSEQRVIASDADGASSVHAADLDGDGDPDVLSASRDDDTIAWYENLGEGDFSSRRVITSDADGALSVYAADLDGDGDLDVLFAAYADDMIAWHENLGEGDFSSQRVIASDADSARSVHAADLDGDGDPDVLSASYNDDTIAWYENLYY